MVQLAAMAKFLEQCGCAYWDLGMHMSYKESLGAAAVDRSQFLAMHRKARDAPCCSPKAGECVGATTTLLKPSAPARVPSAGKSKKQLKREAKRKRKAERKAAAAMHTEASADQKASGKIPEA